MKKPRSKYVKISATVVISAVILYALMSIIDNIGLVYESLSSAVSFILRVLSPVLIGFVVAFLLHRPSDFFARLLQKIKFFSKRIRLSVVLGVFITFILFLAFITVFLYLLIPSVAESIGALSNDAPGYAKVVYDWVVKTSETPTISGILDFLNIEISSADSLTSLLSKFWAEITVILQTAAAAIFGFLMDTGRFLYNFVLGMFFTIYMLMFKQQIKRQLQTLFKAILKGFYYKVAFAYRVADDMFYKFIAGKGMCSIAIGIATFIICSLAGFKYVPLISLIIAVTNIIPTFGPLIGAIPAVLLSMMTSPIYGLYMLIIIIGLQIVEGNIIAPRVLGSSLGLNGFWIIFSIVIMGALFGVVGMLIAAPLFGLIRILIKNMLTRNSKDYEKLSAEMEFNASLQRYHQWTTKKIKKPKEKQDVKL